MPEPTATPAPPDRLPALPSTADAAPYVPVAWLAVAAAGVAGVFALVLLVAGVNAQRERRPLNLPELLLLPAVGLVLAFAARRVVRNAEGTRTGALFGLDLVAAAWWVSLVGGLCYTAYLFAVDFSIRQEATAEVEKFTDSVLKDDLTRAFHRTRNPDERKGISPDDTAALEARYRTEFLAFRQCDLVRVVARNPGQCQFLPGGLREWKPSPVGVECVYAGVMRCPEGLFPLHVPLRGSEGGAVAGEAAAPGRRWQVFHSPSGYVQRDKVALTPYGWRVFDVERQATMFAREFVAQTQNRAARPYVFMDFARVPVESLTGDDAPLYQLSRGGGVARVLSVGAAPGFNALTVPALTVRWTPGPDLYMAVARKMYRLPGGGEPTADQVKLFGASWGLLGLEPPGTRLKESPDVHDLMTITDTAVEVRSPVEIPLASTRGDQAAARGRLVVRCTDPPLLAELKSLRESADPDRGTVPAPPPGKPQPYAWSVVRLESDLKPVAIKQPEGPGAPPQRPGME